MSEETDKIVEAVNSMLIGARKCRLAENQNQCMTGFIYFQGIIDSLTDVLTDIQKIKDETKRLNGREVE